MKIGVTIYPSDYEGKTKALATIVLDDCFVIKGVRVIEGKNGVFISMPSKKNQNEEWVNMCHPITAEFAFKIKDVVIEAYNTKMDEVKDEEVEDGEDDDFI